MPQNVRFFNRKNKQAIIYIAPFFPESQFLDDVLAILSVKMKILLSLSLNKCAISNIMYTVGTDLSKVLNKNMLNLSVVCLLNISTIKLILTLFYDLKFKI